MSSIPRIVLWNKVSQSISKLENFILKFLSGNPHLNYLAVKFDSFISVDFVSMQDINKVGNFWKVQRSSMFGGKDIQGKIDI